MYVYTSAANDGCETGEIRLAGGVANSSSGLVELCVAGVWGTIRDVNSVWSYENAAVVCRQLNLPDDGETLFIIPQFSTTSVLMVLSEAYRLPSLELGFASSRPVLLDSVHCTGSEKALLDCPHASLGNHLYTNFVSPVAIQCKGILYIVGYTNSSDWFIYQKRIRVTVCVAECMD